MGGDGALLMLFVVNCEMIETRSVVHTTQQDVSSCGNSQLVNQSVPGGHRNRGVYPGLMLHLSHRGGRMPWSVPSASG